MRALLDEGISKVALGLTTLYEVLCLAVMEKAVGLTEEDPSRNIGKQRVLVVADDRTIIQVAKYFPRLEGFEVLVSKDEAPVLEAAKRERFYLVVTDYNMPSVNRMTMVRALGAH
jgi:PleD family two-component response regulator